MKLFAKYMINIFIYCIACYQITSFAGSSESTFANSSESITASVSVDQAQQIIASHSENNQFEIIDVRTISEYKSGHIKGARQLDFYRDDFDQSLAKLDRNKTYLLYCRTGVRSTKTLNKMKALGFSKVYNMQGGILAWDKKTQKPIPE